MKQPDNKIPHQVCDELEKNIQILKRTGDLDKMGTIAGKIEIDMTKNRSILNGNSKYSVVVVGPTNSGKSSFFECSAEKFSFSNF
jgi:polynucleotide 5'-kinase involved in rRNA processing